jgi:hypothetical protein
MLQPSLKECLDNVRLCEYTASFIPNYRDVVEGKTDSKGYHKAFKNLSIAIHHMRSSITYTEENRRNNVFFGLLCLVRMGSSYVKRDKNQLINFELSLIEFFIKNPNIIHELIQIIIDANMNQRSSISEPMDHRMNCLFLPSFLSYILQSYAESISAAEFISDVRTTLSLGQTKYALSNFPIKKRRDILRKEFEKVVREFGDLESDKSLSDAMKINKLKIDQYKCLILSSICLIVCLSLAVCGGFSLSNALSNHSSIGLGTGLTILSCIAFTVAAVLLIVHLHNKSLLKQESHLNVFRLDL